MIVPYPSYRGDEPCTQIPTELYFPETGEIHMRAIRVLRETCRGCPSRQPCAEWAIHHEEHGWWGGLSPTERSQIRSRRGLLLTTPNGQLWLREIRAERGEVA